MARRADRDGKVEALSASRTLNAHAAQVSDPAFAAGGFFDARDLVQVKYEMVRRVRVEGEPVASAAQAFGFSRPSWYAAAAALDEDGLPGLLPARPGPRRAHKLTEEIVADLRAALAADPALRTADLVSRVEARFGLRVHPRSVERALTRSEHPKS
jgi:transposase